MDEFLHKDETYRIIGACFEVYKEKGCGSWRPCTKSVWRLNWASNESSLLPGSPCLWSTKVSRSAKPTNPT